VGLQESFVKGGRTVGKISGHLQLSKVWDFRCWLCLGLSEQGNRVGTRGDSETFEILKYHSENKLGVS